MEEEIIKIQTQLDLIDQSILEVTSTIKKVEQDISETVEECQKASNQDEKIWLRNKEFQLLKKETQLREEKNQLLKKEFQLREEKSQLRSEKHQKEGILSSARVRFPPFDPSKYDVSFPTFDSNGDELTMRGRDEAIASVQRAFEELTLRKSDKYLPVVVATSRGMGKTFFLKKIARSDSLYVARKARNVGRIITMECAKAMEIFTEFAPTRTEILEYFWSALAVHHILHLFNGYRVGPIDFQSRTLVAILNIRKGGYRPTDSLDAWIYDTLRLSDENLFKMLRDLTNNAFGVQDESLPLILLDNVHALTTEIEKYSSEFPQQRHTILSKLLTALAPFRIPIVVAGTCDGKLEKIAEYSNFIPRHVFLHCLTIPDAEEMSREIFSSMNLTNRTNLKWASRCDDRVLSTLLLHTSQIPRFIKIATENYHHHREKSTPPQHCLAQFYNQVREYYRDVRKFIFQYPPEIVARILLETQTNQVVGAEVHGTDGMLWKDLENASLVFPFSLESYTMPLIFWVPLADETTSRNPEEVDVRQKWSVVLKEVERLVPGLSIDYLFVSLQDWVKGSTNQTWIGQVYERLIVASFAVKYFQYFSKPNTPYHPHPPDGRVPLIELYNVRENQGEAWKFLSDFYVNLSGGVKLQATEVKVSSGGLGNAIYLNQQVQNSHHDAILPGFLFSCQSNVVAAFQLKNSLSKPEVDVLKKQLPGKPNPLVWFYIDAPDHNSPVNFRVKEVKDAKNEGRLVFLSGMGSINPCMFQLLKEIKTAFLHTHPAQPSFSVDFQDKDAMTDD